MVPVKKYLTGYKTAQKIELFCSWLIPLEELHFLLSVRRRLTGVWNDLRSQKFSEFYLFYLKLCVCAGPSLIAGISVAMAKPINFEKIKIQL